MVAQAAIATRRSDFGTPQQQQVAAENMPVAFASWAHLSDDTEARIKQVIKKLATVDRKSDEHLWLIDMVATFGGTAEAAKELRENVLQGKTVKSFQPAPGGRVAVVEW